MYFPIFISLIGIVCALLTYYVRRLYCYWDRVGVANIKPIIPYGNIRGMGTQYYQGEMTQKLYHEMKGCGPFCGIYFFTVPIALALDLEFVKNVLIKDFSYFHDRGVYFNEKDDPLSAHLFSIEGSKWRNLRTKLTSTFTSGKMKYLFPTMLATANEFRSTFDNMLVNGDSTDVELKDLLARFTTDVIGECAFGIECNSLKDPNAEFRNMGRLVFEKRRNGRLAMIVMQTFHDFARFLGLRTTLDEVAQFFIGIVNETVEYRETNNVSRNDFMDLLIKIKNGKKLNESDSETLSGLSMNELAAQAFVFFLAGFETSSTAMTFAFYELSLNKEIQSKARKEIKEVLDRHGGELSYEAMMDMSYINQIIYESLRKYPPLGNLMRIATKDYPVPNTNHVLRKGTRVWIPVHAIQNDPNYYPEPATFDPDRFSADKMKKRDNATFLAFGDGQRNCIGLRFGLMQARLGIVTLLKNFEFSICPKTNVPLQIAKKKFILSPEGGMWLNVKHLNS